MNINSATSYRDKPLLIAAATLGASFLPICDYGGMNVSLAGIRGFIAQVQQVVDGTGSLDILLLLYFVPLSAAAVVCFSLIDGTARRWALLSGFASIVLPLLLPFITGEVLNASAPDYAQSLLSSADAGSIGVMPGVGFWVLVLLGATQIFISFRRDRELKEKIST